MPHMLMMTILVVSTVTQKLRFVKTCFQQLDYSLASK